VQPLSFCELEEVARVVGGKDPPLFEQDWGEVPVLGPEALAIANAVGLIAGLVACLGELW
jgi:hypothetical protein